ncbi:MAG: NAD-binding protein [Gemmatimonadota bacterium]
MNRRTRVPPATHPGGQAHEIEFNRLLSRVRLALGALFLVMAVGVLGFVLIGGGNYGIIDAIYMTVITLTTVGFAEIIDMSQIPAGRLFTIILVLVGMGIAAYTIPMLAALMIEGQLHNIFMRRRMEKTIAEMVGHHIVCGDTTATWHVAEELTRTQRGVVVVVPDDEALSAARNRFGDIPALVGDPSDDQTLIGAGIERAAGLVFSMASDKDNVIGVLTARRLAPNARIIAATEEPETEAKLQMVGADGVVSPTRIGGLRMASELVRPAVVTFLDKMLRQKGGTLRVEEVSVPRNADVTGRTLASLQIDDIPGALLVAVRMPQTGDFEFKPPLSTPLEPGMTIVVMAEPDGLDKLRTRFRGATGAYPGIEG